MAPAKPFWQTTKMEDMDAQQWESLCDGCGKCCVVRLEDEDNGKIHTTNLGCKLLDGHSCRCTDYANRKTKVPDCVQLGPENVGDLHWMPKTCAYRLLDEGKALPDWHPLNTGDPESTHKAGMSVRGLTIIETKVRIRKWPNHITILPGEA